MVTLGDITGLADTTFEIYLGIISERIDNLKKLKARLRSNMDDFSLEDYKPLLERYLKYDNFNHFTIDGLSFLNSVHQVGIVTSQQFIDNKSNIQSHLDASIALLEEMREHPEYAVTDEDKAIFARVAGVKDASGNWSGGQLSQVIENDRKIIAMLGQLEVQQAVKAGNDNQPSQSLDGITARYYFINVPKGDRQSIDQYQKVDVKNANIMVVEATFGHEKENKDRVLIRLPLTNSKTHFDRVANAALGYLQQYAEKLDLRISELDPIASQISQGLKEVVQSGICTNASITQLSEVDPRIMFYDHNASTIQRRSSLNKQLTNLSDLTQEPVAEPLTLR